jgi:hypothetical protein
VLKRVLRNKEEVHDGWEKNLRPAAMKNKVLGTGDINEGSLHNKGVSALVLR